MSFLNRIFQSKSVNIKRFNKSLGLHLTISQKDLEDPVVVQLLAKMNIQPADVSNRNNIGRFQLDTADKLHTAASIIAKDLGVSVSKVKRAVLLQRAFDIIIDSQWIDKSLHEIILEDINKHTISDLPVSQKEFNIIMRGGLLGNPTITSTKVLARPPLNIELNAVPFKRRGTSLQSSMRREYSQRPNGPRPNTPPPAYVPPPNFQNIDETNEVDPKQGISVEHAIKVNGIWYDKRVLNNS